MCVSCWKPERECLCDDDEPAVADIDGMDDGDDDAA